MRANKPGAGDHSILKRYNNKSVHPREGNARERETREGNDQMI
jgi:hypothetical protein